MAAAIPMIAAALPAVISAISSKFGSKKEKFENKPTLRKDQEPLYRQLQAAGMGQGAGGAFGESADYYRNLLSNQPQDFESFAAPEMRRFNEQIIPGLSAQFAGLGSGALSSSAFRNAAIGAGTDLSERISAIRANLRQGAAQGLQNIGQFGLSPFSGNVYRPPTTGPSSAFAPATGNLMAQGIYDYTKTLGQQKPAAAQAAPASGGTAGQNPTGPMYQTSQNLNPNY